MVQQPATLSFVRKFFELDPADAARSLESLGSEDACAILKNVPAAVSGRAFNFLQIPFGAGLLELLELKEAADILEKMDLNRGAEMVLSLGSELKEGLLSLLDPVTAAHIRVLIAFPEDTAGRMMSQDFLAFHDTVKVKEAVRRIRGMVKKKVPVNYVYVTDLEGRLAGVLNMRDLLLADEDLELRMVMISDVFAVDARMDREEVARQAARKRFLSVPVVDQNRHFLGTIKMDELVEAAQQEATEDLQKMFGAGGNEKVFSPFFFSVRKRLPWLYVNLATAFLAASVVGLFQAVIAKIAILAVFLPIVAGQGGNAGAQSLAVVMRGLVLREIEPQAARKVILREGLLGLVNGILIGVVTALGAWLWHGNPYLGVVIGLAMIINMFMAGISGAGIPVLMQSLGFDPAQSSNIILTTVTDVVGFFVFLGLATLSQGWLQ